MTDSLEGILTSGLGGSFNSMIVGPFRLFNLSEFEETLLKNNGNAPPHIHKPEEQEQPIFHYVLLEIKIGKSIVSKRFKISPKHKNSVIKIIKITNSTISNVNIKVNNIKRKFNNIIIKFTRGSK